MNCNNITLAGIPAQCPVGKGGIETVYIVQASDVEAVTMDAEGEMIETITLAATKKWAQYNFGKGTSYMNSTLNVDETAGYNYVTTEISLFFGILETSKRIEIAALTVGKTAAIVKDANSRYWYIGPKSNNGEYLYASAGTANTGTSKQDQNGYQITLSADADSYPIEIDPSKIDSILVSA